jgi:hypothetical protein
MSVAGIAKHLNVVILFRSISPGDYSNKSECVPVRVRNSNRASPEILYMSNQSGVMWHSRQPEYCPFSG